ncbi:hypothetical protein QYF61_025172 [Mycteria americana]|uniref:Dedicator of cytokinesis N-terminal domain-containing protein n=1 Tax=Mycteria americana TaxID=33587 RepID=A0AAN7SJK4_MYCAM|nr:hypothetical protein QYF61_025172 [Mycteria americana]
MEDLMGDSVKGLTEVQVDMTHCSPLIYWASHFIVEGYHVGTAIVAEGLSRALRWVGWSRLEPAVSGMGQPRPLLTEAALQPRCQHLARDAQCNKGFGWRLNHFPGQPVPMLDNPLGEEKFPNIQSKPPLAQLEAISSCPITCYLGEETDPHLSTTSFQAKQSQLPQPLLIRLLLQTLHQLRCPSLHTLQYLNIPLVVGGPKLNTVFEAKQPQFPQPLLIRLLLQTLHQLRCPSLDMLQHLNVSLVVRGPKLNTVFEVRPHQCRVQGHDHFPGPAGHAIFDTSQDAIGFLGRLGTLLAHIQAAVNQHPQVLLCQAAFQPLFSKPVALHGVAVAQIAVIAGFRGTVPHGLSLEIGDTVQILEKCDGDEEQRNEGDLFHRLWHIMNEILDLRRQVLVGHLTHDRMKDVKRHITARLDWGNEQLGLDLVPRKEYAMVDPEEISVTELYRLGEDSSHSSSAPAWGPSHRTQSSMNFSNMSPSHGLQFFTNCSSVGPFRGVQSCRNRLLQRGSPMGSQVLPANLLQHGLLSPWVHSSCQEPAPAQASHRVTASFGCIHLLWRGVLPGLQVDICSTVNLHGLQVDSLPHHGLHHGLQGNLCSVFFLRTVTASVLGIEHDPQVLFCQAAFQLGGPQHVLVHGIVPLQVQDFALPLVEPQEVPVSPFLQAVEIPLDGSPTLWCIRHLSQFCVISRLAESTLSPIIQIINEDIKQDWTQD